MRFERILYLESINLSYFKLFVYSYSVLANSAFCSILLLNSILILANAKFADRQSKKSSTSHVDVQYRRTRSLSYDYLSKSIKATKVFVAPPIGPAPYRRALQNGVERLASA